MTMSFGLPFAPIFALRRKGHGDGLRLGISLIFPRSNILTNRLFTTAMKIWHCYTHRLYM